MRALLANAVKGVTDGYKRELDIVGVGYKAVVEGQKAVFYLGYSHTIEFPIPKGVTLTVEKATHVAVTGLRPATGGPGGGPDPLPCASAEPYKGKGVHYSDETIIRKAGKAAK